jgi:ketosteroid isomerase-like protein
MMSAGDESIARRFVRAFGAHDQALMDELFAEDVVLYSPLAWPVRGRSALKEYVDEFDRGYPGLRVVLHDEFYSAEGARGCFRFVTHWRNTGTFFGHSPTRQEGTQTETHSVRIREGRIVEQWVGDNSFQMPYMDLVSWGMDFPRNTPDPDPEIVSASEPVPGEEA